MDCIFLVYTQVPKIPWTISAFREPLDLHNGNSCAGFCRGKTSCHSLPIKDFRLGLLMVSLLLLRESVWNNWDNADMLD